MARSPNWKDAETRWLIEIWSEYQLLSKQRNSSQWDEISKELNKVLSKNSIATYRSSDQCKARMKYLRAEKSTTRKSKTIMEGVNVIGTILLSTLKTLMSSWVANPTYHHDMLQKRGLAAVPQQSKIQKIHSQTSRIITVCCRIPLEHKGQAPRKRHTLM